MMCLGIESALDSTAAAPELVPVLIVDDQAPFRAAARAVIARVKGFELVGEATSGEEAVELVEQLVPSIVLMDINMGVMDGLEATRIITDGHPETMVILVSTYTEDEMPLAARTCGAAAYVNKDELSPRVVRSLWEAGGDPGWSSTQI
jgi:two-component system, NarL family, invasion response regulator UvrY